jgi:phosphoglycerate dehydrogenase-like enzyme
MSYARGSAADFAIRSATSGLDPRFDLQLSAQDLRDRVVQVSLERPLRESDVVTLHARVTDETRVFIGRDQFDQMKGGAYS